MKMIEDENGTIEFNQSPRAHWFMKALRMFCWLAALPLIVYGFLLQNSYGDDLTKFGAACVPAGFFLWNWIWNFKQTTYRITRLGVEESYKIFKEKTKMVPFNRIRQIELRETVIGKMRGYASINFDSAGDTSAEITFWDIDNAQEIKRIIESRMQ